MLAISDSPSHPTALRAAQTTTNGSDQLFSVCAPFLRFSVCERSRYLRPLPSRDHLAPSEASSAAVTSASDSQATKSPMRL